MKIETITTENKLRNLSILTDGHYNIEKHGQSFKYENKIFTYIASGLARVVYRSDCGNYVIKVPIGGYFEDEEELKEHLTNDFRYADCTITHNVGEARAYENAPKEYKTFLAKTELLPNCWVRQEFVEVVKCSFTGMHDFREIGKRKDGTFCIFDYNPLLDNFVWNGRCNWERIKRLVTETSAKIIQGFL